MQQIADAFSIMVLVALAGSAIRGVVVACRHVLRRLFLRKYLSVADAERLLRESAEVLERKQRMLEEIQERNRLLTAALLDMRRRVASLSAEKDSVLPGNAEASRRYRDARLRVMRTLHPDVNQGRPAVERQVLEEAFKAVWPAFE